jgi:ABC-type multidrug transport system ATPase subunit
MVKSWKIKKYLRDLSKGNQKKVGIIATLSNPGSYSWRAFC